MVRHIVQVGNVFALDYAGAILIQRFESTLNHFHLALAQWIAHPSDEFFVADVAIAVNVVVLHQSLHVGLLWEYSERRYR